MDYFKLNNFLFIILFVSCVRNQDDFKIRFSKEVRKTFKPQLKKLPPIDYYSILGKKPSREEVELGRELFSDPILSRNNDVSCATCHLGNHGFADGNSLNVGALGQGGPNGDSLGHSFGEGSLSMERTLGDDGLGFSAKSFMFRNSLSTVNVAYRINKEEDRGLFWDGRFGNLSFQVLLPIHTGIEMCGKNPVPIKRNPFISGGYFFKKTVHLTHVNSFDGYTGKDTGNFNATSIDIKGVPTFRPNGSLSIPGRNECLAIAIAKLRTVPYYVKKFKKIYKSNIKDNLLAIALASYVSTHVSKSTPYDKFIRGENNLSISELIGLAVFFTPLNETSEILEQKIKGGGCFKCHTPPEFGGKSYESIGVRTDPRSPLTRPKYVSSKGNSFFGRKRLIRGVFPNCFIESVTVTGNKDYAPDMGRAGGSFLTKDCFKFRVPPLRNIVETYPYFHTGSANGKGDLLEGLSLKKLAIEGLRQAIQYHLNGPVDLKLYLRNRESIKGYFDKTFQRDYLIPYANLDFSGTRNDNNAIKYPITLTPNQFQGLIDFLVYGLWDKDTSHIGDLGNDVTLLRSVPSGFSPSVTRDEGNQLEIPPASL